MRSGLASVGAPAVAEPVHARRRIGGGPGLLGAMDGVAWRGAGATRIHLAALCPRRVPTGSPAPISTRGPGRLTARSREPGGADPGRGGGVGPGPPVAGRDLLGGRVGITAGGHRGPGLDPDRAHRVDHRRPARPNRGGDLGGRLLLPAHRGCMGVGPCRSRTPRSCGARSARRRPRTAASGGNRCRARSDRPRAA